MADVINFLFLNVDLFPLYEVIVCLIFFTLIYITYCACRRFLAVNNKEGRFWSVSRQFWYKRNRGESDTVSSPGLGGATPYEDPVLTQSTVPSSGIAASEAGPTPSVVSPPSSSSIYSRCLECSHPRHRIRRLPRHLLFALLSYCLCILAFVIFALSIETAIVIDPHSCLDVVNESRYDLRDGTGKDVINDGATAGGGFGDEDFDPKSYCNYNFDYPHEEVWLHGYGGSLLHGWWINANPLASGPHSDKDSYSTSGAINRTFLILHGRSLPIPVYKVTLKQIVNELNLTNNAFIFDYEGFGKSNGTPTEENINADAEVALEYVANRMNVSKREIGLMGISLGGSPATNLAVKHNSKALALISSVDSISEEIKSNLKLTGWAVASAIHYRFDTYTQLANFRGCLFFYIGGKDTIIPAWRGQRLYDNARLKDKGCDSLVVDKNADHCGMPGSPFNNTKVAEKFVKWIESPVF